MDVTVSSTCLALYQSPFFIGTRRRSVSGCKSNIALYGDIAEFVTIAFFHHIGDDEVSLVRRQFGNRGTDAKIGITLSEIELPQLLLVISQTIGIIAGA